MGRPKKSVADVQADFDSRWPNRFRVSGCDGLEGLCRLTCLACNTFFERTLRNALARGACPTCSPRPGQHKQAASWTRSREAADAGGVTHLGSNPSGYADRTLRHKFMCHKHGVFTIHRPTDKAVCPKCRGYISPNDPDHLDPKLRSKPCDLYLLEIRDSVGLWTKVGISTNLKARKRNYDREGVVVLRETRVVRMTLYDALVVEREIKRWARQALGRRKCPRKKWAGWSESFADKACTLPAAFDRELARFRGGRRA
jgi:hypothetical protein